MATLLRSVRQKRIVRDLKKARAVNDGIWYPQIGDHVTLMGSGWGEWVILSTAGQICAKDDLPLADKKGGFRKVAYGAVIGGATWVVQRVRDTDRNPVWTDADLNKYGEGEHEQRHVVVTRTKEGVYGFWPYFDIEDEIEVIERASDRTIDELYRCSNRHSGRKVRSLDVEQVSGTAAVGYIACISDYIYFGPMGCKVREECVAILHKGDPALIPVYTTDFATYASRVSIPIVDATARLVPVAAADLDDGPPEIDGPVVSMIDAVQRNADVRDRLTVLVARLPEMSNADAVHLLSVVGYKCWLEHDSARATQ